MPPLKRVKILNADEYRILENAVASRKIAAGKARRVKIVLLSNQGFTAREIAEGLECNERTVPKWIGRFFETWRRIDDAIEKARNYWNAHRYHYVWGRRRRHRAARRGPSVGAPARR